MSADELDPWVVLYRDDSLLMLDPPLVFMCRAEDGDHAEEQCVSAVLGRGKPVSQGMVVGGPVGAATPCNQVR